MTRFALASEPKQYAQCHRLMKSLGMKRERFGWPTILAYDEHGELKGFMSTMKRNDAVIGGPLCVKIQSPLFVTRLISAYESWLAHCGIKFYWFHVNNTTPIWKILVDKCADKYGNIKKLGDDETGSWYQRDLYDKTQKSDTVD